MAIKKGRKKLKPISQRGKGERRITFAQSKAKSTGAMIQPKRKSNSSAKNFTSAYKSGTKTGSGSTLGTRLKQARLTAKSKIKSSAKKGSSAMSSWSSAKMKAMKKLWAGNRKG